MSGIEFRPGFLYVDVPYDDVGLITLWVRTVRAR